MGTREEEMHVTNVTTQCPSNQQQYQTRTRKSIGGLEEENANELRRKSSNFKRAIGRSRPGPNNKNTLNTGMSESLPGRALDIL